MPDDRRSGKVKKLRLLLAAVLLGTFLGGVSNAQTIRQDAEESIRRGNEKYAQSKYRAAIEEYRQVPAQMGEIYAQSLYNIGVCYYELWLTEDAVVMYRKAVE